MYVDGSSTQSVACRHTAAHSTSLAPKLLLRQHASENTHLLKILNVLKSAVGHPNPDRVTTVVGALPTANCEATPIQSLTTQLDNQRSA